MWETRCFLPSALGYALGSAHHQPLLLPGKLFDVSDECMSHELLAPLASEIVEQRTDVYLSLPPPLSHHVGLKLRNEKKAEVKFTREIVHLGDNATQKSEDRGTIVAAEWMKYADKLKHGFEKRKKLIEFLHDARNCHTDAAAACLEAKGSHRALPVVDVSKERRKLMLGTAAGMCCCVEETQVRLHLRRPEGDAEEEGAQAQRQQPDVLLTSIGVESTNRALVEALGRHWHAWFAGSVWQSLKAEHEAVAHLQSVSGVLSYPEVVDAYCHLPTAPAASKAAAPARM